MDNQWYRSPSVIILMIFGGVLLIAFAIDRQSPRPATAFDSPPNPSDFLQVSNEQGNSSVMNLPLDVLTERLAQKLEKNPNDIPGWTLLGRSYANLGQHEKSTQAFEKALVLAPNDVNLRVTYGEILISSAGGRVTPQAHKVFMAAHKIEPENPGVRFNLALAEHQAGNSQKAYDILTDILGKAPDGAPWMERVQERRNQIADELKLPVSTFASIQPNQKENLSGENSLPSQDNQEAFIRSMVDRLAARMENNPNDLEGWMKLGRSYMVLKEYDKAARTYKKALALDPGNKEIQTLHQEASELAKKFKR